MNIKTQRYGVILKLTVMLAFLGCFFIANGRTVRAAAASVTGTLQTDGSISVNITWNDDSAVKFYISPDGSTNIDLESDISKNGTDTTATGTITAAKILEKAAANNKSSASGFEVKYTTTSSVTTHTALPKTGDTTNHVVTAPIYKAMAGADSTGVTVTVHAYTSDRAKDASGGDARKVVYCYSNAKVKFSVDVTDSTKFVKGWTKTNGGTTPDSKTEGKSEIIWPAEGYISEDTTYYPIIEERPTATSMYIEYEGTDFYSDATVYFKKGGRASLKAVGYPAGSNPSVEWLPLEINGDITPSPASSVMNISVGGEATNLKNISCKVQAVNKNNGTVVESPVMTVKPVDFNVSMSKPTRGKNNTVKVEVTPSSYAGLFTYEWTCDEDVTEDNSTSGEQTFKFKPREDAEEVTISLDVKGMAGEEEFYSLYSFTETFEYSSGGDIDDLNFRNAAYSVVEGYDNTTGVIDVEGYISSTSDVFFSLSDDDKKYVSAKITGIDTKNNEYANFKLTGKWPSSTTTSSSSNSNKVTVNDGETVILAAYAKDDLSVSDLATVTVYPAPTIKYTAGSSSSASSSSSLGSLTIALPEAVAKGDVTGYRVKVFYGDNELYSSGDDYKGTFNVFNKMTELAKGIEDNASKIGNSSSPAASETVTIKLYPLVGSTEADEVASTTATVYHVTVKGDNLTASVTPRYALPGRSVSLSVTPNDGYKFSKWSDSAGGTSASRSVTVSTSGNSYTATVEKISSSTDSGTGSKNSSSGSNGEYDQMPDTGESNTPIWLIIFMVFAVIGSGYALYMQLAPVKTDSEESDDEDE